MKHLGQTEDSQGYGVRRSGFFGLIRTLRISRETREEIRNEKERGTVHEKMCSRTVLYGFVDTSRFPDRFNIVRNPAALAERD